MTSFEELYEHYEHYVFSQALKLTRNYHVAQDVSQNVWLRVWRYLPRLQPAPSYTAWLNRIVFTVAMDHFRHMRTEPTVPFDDSVEAIVAPEHDYGQQELVKSLVAQLPETNRNVLLLLEAGYSAMELAARTGLSYASIKQRRYRARMQLLELLRAEEEKQQ